MRCTPEVRVSSITKLALTSSLLLPSQIWVKPHAPAGIHASLALRICPVHEIVCAIARPLTLLHGVNVMDRFVVIAWLLALGWHVGGWEHASPSGGTLEISLLRASPGRKAVSSRKKSFSAFYSLWQAPVFGMST